MQYLLHDGNEQSAEHILQLTLRLMVRISSVNGSYMIGHGPRIPAGNNMFEYHPSYGTT